MFEDLGAFLNAYPILWVVYGFLISVPVVAIVSYIFWPKSEADSVGYRKKTDVLTPDDKDKEDIGDSGIEASGENGRSSCTSEEKDVPTVSPQSISDNRSHDQDSRTVKLKNLDGSRDTNGVNTEDALKSHDTSHDKRINGKFSSNNQVLTENGFHSRFQSNKTDLEPELNSHHTLENGMENESEPDSIKWNFPPVLEDFDLMESDVDPSQLEDYFNDPRLIEVKFTIEPHGPGIGIGIVGGSGSPNGDLPIIIKRVLPDSLSERDGRLKAGDELIAVNETLLVGMSKDFAINTLSKMEGDVRLLVLQDD